MDEAGELHQVADSTWELHDNGRVLLYVDAAGVVETIGAWAKRACLAAVDEGRGKAPSPLLVSGLVKVRCPCYTPAYPPCASRAR